jgi:hypothetical protein
LCVCVLGLLGHSGVRFDLRTGGIVL